MAIYANNSVYLLPIGTMVRMDAITGTIVGTATMHDDARSTMTTKYVLRLEPEHRGYVAQQGAGPIAAATDGLDEPNHDVQQIFISTVVADVGNVVPVNPGQFDKRAIEWEPKR